MDLLDDEHDGSYGARTVSLSAALKKAREHIKELKAQQQWREKRIAELEARERAFSPRKLIQRVADIDFENGDCLQLKLGGDGDNGEYLIELIEEAMNQLQPPEGEE